MAPVPLRGVEPQTPLSAAPRSSFWPKAASEGTIKIALFYKAKIRYNHVTAQNLRESDGLVAHMISYLYALSATRQQLQALFEKDGSPTY